MEETGVVERELTAVIADGDNAALADLYARLAFPVAANVFEPAVVPILADRDVAVTLVNSVRKRAKRR